MFEPVSHLFTKKDSVVWQDYDVRYFIQDYLRQHIKSEQVYCQSVHAGCAVVRVESPTLFQETRLVEYDLVQELKKRAKYNLREVKIIQ